jgi:hypothetical protein
MLVTKELKDIAFKYADLAGVYMTNGQYFRPAFKTGILFNRVTGYNDVSRMLKEQSEGRVVLALDYGPPGALYGKFVHGGHLTRNKDESQRWFIEGRPYAQYAANDPQIQMLIDVYIKSEMDKKLGELASELDVQLTSFASLKDKSKK